MYTADRLGILTSSAEYYRAVVDAIRQAKRQVIIVGWDFDSRVTMIREEKYRDHPDFGKSFGEILCDCVTENPKLDVYVSKWNAPYPYDPSQRRLSEIEGDIGADRGIHCQYLDSASAFRSQHEKYVVIDGVLAFMGGMDITAERWDNTDHVHDSPHRVSPDGVHYAPYHDVQTVVTGQAAQKLADMGRQRWINGSHRRPKPDMIEVEDPPWPDGVEVVATDHALELILTRSYTREDVVDDRGLKNRYVDLIQSAQESIYIENQYFSCADITAALGDQLKDPDGPEVILMVPRIQPDFMGRISMELTNTMHLNKLIEADIHERLAVIYPMCPDAPKVDIQVHSKTMIIDRKTAVIGSANINNRSMYFDDESAFVIHDNPGQPFVDDLLYELVGILSNTDPESVAGAVDQHASLLHGVLAVERATNALDHVKTVADKNIYPEAIRKIFDMTQAPFFERISHTILGAMPTAAIRRTLYSLFLIGGMAALWIGLIIALGDTPQMRDNLNRFVEIGLSSPYTAIYAIGAFWLSTALFIPIVVPILLVAGMLGPWWGSLYSMLGMVTAGLAFYAVGRAIPLEELMQKFKPLKRTANMLQRIRGHGIWAVATTKLLPSGPYLIVNLVTGGLDFTLKDFLIGTAIGVLPGVLAFSFFGSTAVDIYQNPTPTRIALFIGFIITYILAARWLIKLTKRLMPESLSVDENDTLDNTDQDAPVNHDQGDEQSRLAA